MSRIIVIGGVNMDLHLFEVEASGGQAPLLAGRYLAQPGGKGGNVARAAARLGADVKLLARVGGPTSSPTWVSSTPRTSSSPRPRFPPMR